MKIFKAEEVAEALLALAVERRIEVSNLKLQKLMYYAQAWSLVLHGRELFPEDFEAWVHGPVIPAIFRKYKVCGWKPIGGREVEPIDPELRAHLVQVLRAYGKFRATELERLTHSEDPWKDARGPLASDEPSRKVIPKESIRAYYSRKNHGKAKEKA